MSCHNVKGKQQIKYLVKDNFNKNNVKNTSMTEQSNASELRFTRSQITKKFNNEIKNN